MRRLLLATLLSTTIAVSGCSMLTVHGPESRDMACTTDNLAPALDFGYATSAGLTATNNVVMGIARNEPLLVSSAGLSLLLSAIYLYSGVSGMGDTRRCRRHINTQYDRLRSAETVDEDRPADVAPVDHAPPVP